MGEFQDGFEFPDYFGIPKGYSNKLSSEEVDWLQDQIKEIGFYPE